VYGVADLGYRKAYAALYWVGFPTYVIIQPVTVTKSQTNRNMMLAVHPVTGRFPWAVSTSVYLAPRVQNIGVLVDYRIGS
jgi:hypothetical protein